MMKVLKVALVLLLVVVLVVVKVQAKVRVERVKMLAKVLVQAKVLVLVLMLVLMTMLVLVPMLPPPASLRNVKVLTMVPAVLAARAQTRNRVSQMNVATMPTRQVGRRCHFLPSTWLRGCTR